jgi:hypothetical protein
VDAVVVVGAVTGVDVGVVVVDHEAHGQALCELASRDHVTRPSTRHKQQQGGETTHGWTNTCKNIFLAPSPYNVINKSIRHTKHYIMSATSASETISKANSLHMLLFAHQVIYLYCCLLLRLQNVSRSSDSIYVMGMKTMQLR